MRPSRACRCPPVKTTRGGSGAAGPRQHERAGRRQRERPAVGRPGARDPAERRRRALPSARSTDVRARPATARRPSDDQSAPRPGSLKRTWPLRSETETCVRSRPTHANSGPPETSAGVCLQAVVSAARRARANADDRVLRERRDRVARADTARAGARRQPRTPAAQAESRRRGPPTITLRKRPAVGRDHQPPGPARLLQKANARPFGDAASATSAYGLRETLRRAAPGATR